MREDSAFAINHFLRSNGLASLNEAGPLVAQLAMFVRDDRHLATLLNQCEPSERRRMYDALAPNVRFRPRPFADYLIEAAQDAERRQLPTIGPGGALLEYRPPELRTAAPSDEATATAAIRASLAKEHLFVVCLLCAREEQVDGIDKEDTVRQLRKLGWRMGHKRSEVDPTQREDVEICPACVRKRAPRLRLT